MRNESLLFVPDTCVFITAFRRKDSMLFRWMMANQRQIHLSVIVAAELHRAWDPKRRRPNDLEDQRILSKLTLIDFTMLSARAHGSVFRLRPDFCGDHEADGLIAAQALQRRAVLVTEEADRFASIPILRVWRTRNASVPESHW